MAVSGTTIIRTVVGSLFLGHGLRKATTRFGGRGIAATAAGFDAIGLRPGRTHARAAAASEAAGGVSLLLGAATPAGAAAITGAMTVAATRVHAKNGLWAPTGVEYNLVLMAIAYGVTASGPGRPSIDGRWLPALSGHRWAIAQLAVGVLAGLAVGESARRRTAAETTDVD